MCDRCNELEKELALVKECNAVLLAKFNVACFAPDVMVKKIRILQKELDERDGVKMFDDLYIDRG